MVSLTDVLVALPDRLIEKLLLVRPPIGLPLESLSWMVTVELMPTVKLVGLALTSETEELTSPATTLKLLEVTLILEF